MEIDLYLKKIAGFTEEDVVRELEDICVELHINPKRHTIFIASGGLGYTLDSIVTDVYLSRRPIDDNARQKLLLLHILIESEHSIPSILRINTDLKHLKKKEREYERLSKQKMELVARVEKKVKYAYQNCFTCADHPNGCGGEDDDCKCPDYKDWRPGKS